MCHTEYKAQEHNLFVSTIWCRNPLCPQMQERNERIFTDWTNGFKLKELSAKYNISEQSCSKIITRIRRGEDKNTSVKHTAEKSITRIKMCSAETADRIVWLLNNDTEARVIFEYMRRGVLCIQSEDEEGTKRGHSLRKRTGVKGVGRFKPGHALNTPDCVEKMKRTKKLRGIYK